MISVSSNFAIRQISNQFNPFPKEKKIGEPYNHDNGNELVERIVRAINKGTYPNGYHVHTEQSQLPSDRIHTA